MYKKTLITAVITSGLVALVAAFPAMANDSFGSVLDVDQITDSCANWDVIYLSPQAQEFPNYNVYHNQRFDFSIAFPNYFVQAGELAGNGDGISFQSNGAELSVYGEYNVLYESFEERFERYASDGTIAAKDIDASHMFYILDQGSSEYAVYSQGDDMIVTFELIYPKEEHDTYAGIIEHMKNSIQMP